MSSFALLHLIMQGGTHQCCPFEMPLSSAVTEKGTEKAHFQSCLPEEHLEDLFGRFFLQISFQVITDLAVGHLANPQRTQIKTPRSPAP